MFPGYVATVMGSPNVYRYGRGDLVGVFVWFSKCSYSVALGFVIRKIVDDICGKFDGLVQGAVCMLFDVPGYKKFKVDSDDDIQNMLCLSKSFRINHIDVLIQKSSVGVGRNCGVLDYTEDGGIS
ncbi:hypothetical protein CsSME_00026775 [Camellia sinensis var. sinensis]